MGAGRHAEVLVGYRVVDHLKLAEESAIEIGRYVLGAPIVHKEDPQPFIPETNDHPPLLLLHYCTTLRYSSARDVGVEALALGAGSRSLFGVRGRSLGRGDRMRLRPSHSAADHPSCRPRAWPEAPLGNGTQPPRKGQEPVAGMDGRDTARQGQPDKL